jgi:hypothetical protein
LGPIELLAPWPHCPSRRLLHTHSFSSCINGGRFSPFSPSLFIMCCVCHSYPCLLTDSIFPEASTPPEFMSSGHRSSKKQHALPSPPSSPSEHALVRRDTRVARVDHGDSRRGKVAPIKTLQTYPMHADGVYPLVVCADDFLRDASVLDIFLRGGGLLTGVDLLSRISLPRASC